MWSQICFVAASVVWIGVLIPIQVRQARMARQFASAAQVPVEYRALARRWLAWGLVATVPVIAASDFMIDKTG